MKYSHIEPRPLNEVSFDRKLVIGEIINIARGAKARENAAIIVESLNLFIIFSKLVDLYKRMDAIVVSRMPISDEVDWDIMERNKLNEMEKRKKLFLK